MRAAPRYTYERAPSIALQERIVQALIAAEADGRGRLDARAIAAGVHSSERNVRRVLGHMLAAGAARRIRIAGWRRGERSGWPTALYGVGAKEDAARPPAYTPAQLNRRYRANNPDKVVENTVRRRAHWLHARRDPMTTTFFGEAK